MISKATFWNNSSEVSNVIVVNWIADYYFCVMQWLSVRLRQQNVVLYRAVACPWISAYPSSIDATQWSSGTSSFTLVYTDTSSLACFAGLQGVRCRTLVIGIERAGAWDLSGNPVTATSNHLIRVSYCPRPLSVFQSVLKNRPNIKDTKSFFVEEYSIPTVPLLLSTAANSVQLCF